MSTQLSLNTAFERFVLALSELPLEDVESCNDPIILLAMQGACEILSETASLRLVEISLQSNTESVSYASL